MKKGLWGKVMKAKPMLEPSAFDLLSKYKARSEFAIGLRNTKNESLTLDTSEAYFAMLKLSLVYSALELLDNATGKSGNLQVRSMKFSYDLKHGRFKKLIDQILISTPANSKSKVLRIIENLEYKDWEVGGPNLYEFIGLCRHLMFHGVFSPSGSGLSRSPRKVQSLIGLSYDAIQAGDEFLEKWLDKKIMKANRIRK